MQKTILTTFKATMKQPNCTQWRNTERIIEMTVANPCQRNLNCMLNLICLLHMEYRNIEAG